MTMKLSHHSALVLLLIVGTSATVHGQRGGFGGRGGFTGRGGFGAGLFGSTGSAAFALRADVQKELGLKEDQVDELRELSREAPSTPRIMQEMGIDFQAMRDMSSEERQEIIADVQKTIAKKNREANKEVMELLTSKQERRFKELKFQYDVSQGRAVAALAGAEIDLSDNDQKTLNDALKDANATLNARIAELRRELYSDALNSVVSDSKIKSLMGAAFAFDSGDSRNRFGGGRGGRARGGGQRGGGDNAENPRRRRAGSDEEEEVNPRRRRNN